jgi:hypothetical protein
VNGHNILRDHLHPFGLLKFSQQEWDSIAWGRLSHIIQCDALVTLRHFFLVSGRLDPQDIRELIQDQSWPLVML